MNVTTRIFSRESQLWSWIEHNCDCCKKGCHPMHLDPTKRTKCTCRKAQELYKRLDNGDVPVRITTARVCQHKQCPEFTPVPVPMAYTAQSSPTLFD